MKINKFAIFICLIVFGLTGCETFKGGTQGLKKDVDNTYENVGTACKETGRCVFNVAKKTVLGVGAVGVGTVKGAVYVGKKTAEGAVAVADGVVTVSKNAVPVVKKGAKKAWKMTNEADSWIKDNLW